MFQGIAQVVSICGAEVPASEIRCCNSARGTGDGLWWLSILAGDAPDSASSPPYIKLAVAASLSIFHSYHTYRLSSAC